MRTKIPVFIKATLIEGGRHVYIAADTISAIQPTNEGTRIWDKGSEAGVCEWHVRETVAEVFDQLRRPFSKLPTNIPSDPGE